MKILVFGRTGQVATELQRQAKVIALGRDQADLSDPETCVAQLRAYAPDIVINGAAYTAVDLAEQEEELATTVNGVAPTVLARAAAELGVPFVHISTDYVFDGQGERPWQPDDPTGPLGAYGRSKLVGEEGVRKANGAHVILRTSWVFSSHGNNFLKSMLRLAESRDHLKIVSDQIGGPTPATDIAAACLSIGRALKVDPSKSGTYHFAGAPQTSWAGFAREIFSQCGKHVTVEDIPTSEYPTPASRPLNSRMNCSDLKRVFGVPQPDWRDGVKIALAELGAC